MVHTKGTGQPIASVVIPAYNEAKVIGRTLRTLRTGQPDEASVEVIVACNGCTDGTAEAASNSDPSAIVLDLPEPGKIGALNAGDQKATAFPRVYLDADIDLPWSSLVRLVDAFASDPDLLCAAPRIEFELEDRPWIVRRFYDGFTRLPYIVDDMVGTGVYALSQEGRARFDKFPEITGDDEFVRSLFPRGQRQTIAGVTFRVRPAKTVQGLIQVRRRVYRGNAELGATHGKPQSPTNTLASVLKTGRKAPVSVAVFMAVNAWARFANRRAGNARPRWERDETTR